MTLISENLLRSPYHKTTFQYRKHRTRVKKISIELLWNCIKSSVSYHEEREIPMGEWKIESNEPLVESTVIERHRKPRGKERLTKEKFPKHLVDSTVYSVTWCIRLWERCKSSRLPREDTRCGIWSKNRVPAPPSTQFNPPSSHVLFLPSFPPATVNPSRFLKSFSRI